MIQERLRTRQRIAPSGPLTAREALAIVLPAAQEVSADCRLVLITSGEDVGPSGRSLVWEFGFHFPKRLGQGIYGVAPCDMEASETALCLTTELSPHPGARADQPGLPLAFKDSPGAVEELAQAGADWLAGSTRMNLQTRQQADGQAVWWASSYGQEFQTPFLEG